MTEQAVETTAVTTETVEVTDTKPVEIDWKAKAREWEKRAKANADAASKLAQLEESQKTEAQKLADRAVEAEKQRDALLIETLRNKVALHKGLPPELVDRLRGSTEEEMSADADALLALIPATSRPRGDVDQGVRSAIPLNGDPLLRDLKAKLGIA